MYSASGGPGTEPAGGRWLRRPDLDARPAWRSFLGLSTPWLGEDIITALLSKFCHGIWLEDADAFSALAGRPALFLANHQVAVESMLFAAELSPFLGTPLHAISKQEHRDTWIGQLFGLFYSYPGVINPDSIFFVRLGDPQALLDLVDQMVSRMEAKRCGTLIHVAASRVLSCRSQVRSMSSVFLDLAVRHRFPIVPVKFRGGLPMEPSEGFLDFPTGHGGQDYFIGRPIEPETLDAMSLVDRRTLVLDRINGLGVPLDREHPMPADPAFKSDVWAFMERFNVLEPAAAVAWAALRRLPNPSEETVLLLRGIEEGRLIYQPTPTGRWLGAVARWLTEGHMPITMAGR